MPHVEHGCLPPVSLGQISPNDLVGSGFPGRPADSER